MPLYDVPVSYEFYQQVEGDTPEDAFKNMMRSLAIRTVREIVKDIDNIPDVAVHVNRSLIKLSDVTNA